MSLYEILCAYPYLPTCIVTRDDAEETLVACDNMMQQGQMSLPGNRALIVAMSQFCNYILATPE